MSPFLILICAPILLGIVSCGSTPHAARTGPRCGQEVVRGRDGVRVQVLFAKNGAAQRYQILRSSGNAAVDHTSLRELEHRFGVAASNAPPLRFRWRQFNGRVRLAATVDSCGRVTRIGS